MLGVVESVEPCWMWPNKANASELMRSAVVVTPSNVRGLGELRITRLSQRQWNTPSLAFVVVTLDFNRWGISHSAACTWER